MQVNRALFADAQIRSVREGVVVVSLRDALGTVLVTGATGFIGRSVCNHLNNEGFRVLAGIRGAGSQVTPGCTPVIVRDSDPSIKADRFEGVFAVVHAAGLAHVQREDSESEYVRVNALFTKEVAEAAAAAGVKKFIFLSSTRVLGDATDLHVPLDDTSTEDPTSPYCHSKALAEQYLRAIAHASDMEIYILRLPVVYGPGAKANIARLLAYANSSLPNIFIRSRARRSMISLENVNSAVGHVLRQSENVSDSSVNPVTMLIRDGHDLGVGEVIDKLRWSQGKRRARLPLPRSFLRPLLLPFGNRDSNARLLSSFQVRDQRLREMGWEPVLTVEQGLSNCVNEDLTQLVLLFVVTEDWYFVSHRMDLAEAALASGYEVHLACRVGDHGKHIERAGIVLHPLKLTRRNSGPIRQFSSVLELRRLYQQLKPDLVHHVALKPIVFGSLARIDLPIPAVVNTFAGMGSLFSGDSSKNGLRSRLVLLALKRILAIRNSWSVVQNRDDEDLFINHNLAGSNRLVMIAGSGVDTHNFPLTPLPSLDRLRFTLVARMLSTKGIRDFIDALQILRHEGFSVDATLVGLPDEFNPDSIPLPTLQEWDASGVVNWLGYQEDVQAIWSNSHVAVLPTRYREGIPKSLLEAAAMGRPLIGCDVPGVRDLIRHGVNGLLVPPNDVSALAQAMAFFLRSPSLIREMGLNARRTVEEDFSNDQVLRQYLDLYRRTLGLRS